MKQQKERSLLVAVKGHLYWPETKFKRYTGTQTHTQTLIISIGKHVVGYFV